MFAISQKTLPKCHNLGEKLFLFDFFGVFYSRLEFFAIGEKFNLLLLFYHNYINFNQTYNL
jgi:hypothetical protein